LNLRNGFKKLVNYTTQTLKINLSSRFINADLQANTHRPFKFEGKRWKGEDRYTIK